MIIKLKYLLILLLINSLTVKAQYHYPADTLATNETRWLLSSMQRLAGAGVMFGHHDDTAYGVNWRLKDSSDVKNVTGSYPAIYGWDLSGIEVDSTYDINGIPFTKQNQLIREAYERGGINTISWHMYNPVNCKTSWDNKILTIKELLPGGTHHTVYLTYLDKAAQYLQTLKGSNGEPIPILFRPFHELTGDWFWWGSTTSTPEEFIDFWRFTTNYLRGTKKLHNLLMVFSTADFFEEYDLLERYPGDAYVDVMGFDRYCTDSLNTYQTEMNRQLDILQKTAAQHQKLTCIAETGYQGIPAAKWWTDVLTPILSLNNKVSYVMLWRNHGADHYFTPYPGQVSAADFKDFYKNSNVMFQDRLTPMAVYGPKHVLHYSHNIGQ